jgi:NADH-quinone oxidoreductase subunit H
VKAVGDVVPSGHERLPAIGVKRGDAPPTERQISLSGYKASAPTDLLGAGIVLGIAAAIILLFMAPTAGIITWVERRVSGRMQSRIGPNRAGPQGFFVWLADGIKSILKEDIIPAESDQMLFRLAPYLVFVGVSATFVVMPFGQYLIAADLDIGILFVIAVTSLVTIGLMTGGWASNNKWSLLGGIRSAAQIISYEIPGAVAIVCIVMMTGSLRMQDIIIAQGGPGGSFIMTGGWPWYWYVFKNPITFALFFLYFTTALAEGNRAPFDLPEAESELVAGYSTEYSGMRYLFFFFAEWANVFVMSGIASALFLGGWQIPGVSPAQQEAHFGLQLLGAFLFLLKSWILIFVVVWIRWTLPRVRIDQMMNLCWKWFVPLSFAAFLLTALWIIAEPAIGRSVQLVVSVVTFVTWALLMVHFIRRVQYNLRESRVAIHLNPFL